MSSAVTTPAATACRRRRGLPGRRAAPRLGAGRGRSTIGLSPLWLAPVPRSFPSRGLPTRRARVATVRTTTGSFGRPAVILAARRTRVATVSVLGSPGIVSASGPTGRWIRFGNRDTGDISSNAVPPCRAFPSHALPHRSGAVPPVDRRKVYPSRRPASRTADGGSRVVGISQRPPRHHGVIAGAAYQTRCPA